MKVQKLQPYIRFELGRFIHGLIDGISGLIMDKGIGRKSKGVEKDYFST